MNVIDVDNPLRVCDSDNVCIICHSAEEAHYYKELFKRGEKFSTCKKYKKSMAAMMLELTIKQKAKTINSTPKP